MTRIAKLKIDVRSNETKLIHPWRKCDLSDSRRDFNRRLLHARSTSFANMEMLIKLRKFISVSFDNFRNERITKKKISRLNLLLQFSVFIYTE